MKKNKNLNLKLICSLSLLFLLGIIFYHAYFPISPGSFSIIVLPDTQKYSAYYPDIFLNQTQWIVDNQKKFNIKFVIHEGDLVNNKDNLTQWEIANESMYILEKNNIPYSVIPGNHDKSNYYNIYFPISIFADKTYFGGNFNKNDNNYHLLTIDGKDFLFLNLDFCPSTDEINWADDILSNSDYLDSRITILTTHGYLNEDAERNVHVCGDTEYLWQMAKKHKNLQIILCVHLHTEARRIDLNDAGKQVYQILTNYQDMEYGGGGFLRIMNFNFKNNRLIVKTYSPYFDTYKKDTKSQFILQLEN